MAKRRLHLVLDLSMSNHSMIGPIYMFLAELLQFHQDDPELSYALTWFTGVDTRTGEEDYHTVSFDNSSSTREVARVLDEIRNIRMTSGYISSDSVIKKAIRKSITTLGQGEQELETTLLLFTDFRCTDLLFTEEDDGCLRRAILFLPGNRVDTIQTGFRFRTEAGITRNIPVCLFALEDLQESWNEQDWASFRQLL